VTPKTAPQANAVQVQMSLPQVPRLYGERVLQYHKASNRSERSNLGGLVLASTGYRTIQVTAA